MTWVAVAWNAIKWFGGWWRVWLPIVLCISAWLYVRHVEHEAFKNGKAECQAEQQEALDAKNHEIAILNAEHSVWETVWQAKLLAAQKEAPERVRKITKLVEKEVATNPVYAACERPESIQRERVQDLGRIREAIRSGRL